MCLCTSVMWSLLWPSEGPFIPNRLQAFSSLQGRLGGCKPPRAPTTQRRQSPGWSIGSLVCCSWPSMSAASTCVPVNVLPPGWSFSSSGYLPLWLSLRSLVAGASRPALDISVDLGRSSWRFLYRR